MKLIVGLGNPSEEYNETRHNLGFVIIDQLTDKLKVKLNKEKFNGLYYQTQDYILLKPQTGMNNSGKCVSSFLKYFAIPIDNLLIIYDDIGLPIGNFRYRAQGSGGGHNGVKDIIELLGSRKIKLLRIGIGCDNKFLLSDWVLGKFINQEKETINIILPSLINSLLEWINGNSFDKIMNAYNKRKVTRMD